MKKKISLLTAFIFIAILSMAQINPFSPVKQGTPAQVIQAQGALQGLLGIINGRYTDTAQANTTPISLVPGAQIAVGDTVFFRNQTATKWILIGLGTFRNDTLQAIRPLGIDSISPTLSRIKLLTQRALVFGGTTTMHSCLSIDVIPTGVFINYNFYSSPGVTLTVTAADPSFPRIDAVVIDTLGQISIITGTPSSLPQIPTINIASQFLLTTYPVAAGGSCIGIITEIVYDQNTGPTAEWAPTTFGTLTNDFGNTVNPFHLTIADFVSTYTNGSGIIFTRTGNDTAQANEILKLYIYSNGIFGNQIKIQFFHDAAAVGNQITFNSGYGFNGNNADVYQNTSIPFSAFGLTNQIFNKIVITYAGDDLSGAKGLYNDYIQLQTGVSNTNAGEDHGVFNFYMNPTGDTLYLVRFDGVIFKVLVSGGGGGSSLANFYLKDSTLSSNRVVVLDNKDLNFEDFGGMEFFLQPSADMMGLSTAGGSSIVLQNNVITYTGTHTFNGSIVYNTPVSGAITDSILTWDAATGIVNMRDGASLISSMQQTFNKSVELGDIPKINGHGINDLFIDSLSTFLIHVYDPLSVNSSIIDAEPFALTLSNTGAEGQSALSESDTTNYLQTSDNFSHTNKLVVAPQLFQFQANSSSASRITIQGNLDSSDANVNSIMWVASDNSWHKGHIPSPNLQQVTDVGFITTNPLFVLNDNAGIEVEGSAGSVDIGTIAGAPILEFISLGGGHAHINITNITNVDENLEFPTTSGTIVSVTTGAVAPASTPSQIGEIYVDTVAKKLYFATGTASSSDWTIAN